MYFRNYFVHFFFLGGGGGFLYSGEHFGFPKKFCVLLKKAVLFFRKIFDVIQETF